MIIFTARNVKKNSVGGGGVSRPRPRGEVGGSGRKVSRPTPVGRLGGLATGVCSPTPGGVSRPTPGGDVSRPTLGGCIPACTEADPPSRWLLLRAVHILLEYFSCLKLLQLTNGVVRRYTCSVVSVYLSMGGSPISQVNKFEHVHLYHMSTPPSPRPPPCPHHTQIPSGLSLSPSPITIRGNWESGRYASYLNVFLLRFVINHSIRIKTCSNRFRTD